jgi:hypothetical protein
MKEEYDQIISDIEKIEDNTLKIELQSAASTLYSNYEMLNKMKEDYLKMQQTTPEQQKDVDTITTEVVPNPPQDPEIIKN